jgi:type IV secretion system protein VirB6
MAGSGDLQNANLDPIKKILNDLANSIDGSLLQTIQDVYTKVAHVVLPIVAGIIMCWVLFKAIQIVITPNGSGGISDFAKQFFKIAVIMILLSSWVYFAQYVVHPVMSVPSELISAIGGNDPNEPNTLIVAFVDNMFTQVTGTYEAISTDNGQIWGAFFAGFVAVILLVVCAFTLGAYFWTVIKNKLMLALLLILSPVFFSFLMFTSTKDYFKNWVNMIANALVTLLVLNIIVITFASMMKNLIGSQSLNGMAGAFACLVVGGLMIKFIDMSSEVASNLVSSGFALSSHLTNKSKAPGTEGDKNAAKEWFKNTPAGKTYNRISGGGLDKDINAKK